MMKPIWAGAVLLALSACAEWGTLSQNEPLVATETRMRAKAMSHKAEATAEQRAAFGVLADFPGRTFRGEPDAGSTEAFADVQQWSWTEDGTGLLIKHAIEDGSYGGETIVRKNPETGSLDYIYYTNAGFSTQGSFSLGDDGSWEAVEEVTGQGDVTKVRSIGRIQPNGDMLSSSDYFSNGEWTPGHSFTYREVWQELPALDKPVQKDIAPVGSQ